MVLYDLKKVTGIYVKSFLSFVEENKISVVENKEAIYELFSYAIKSIHGFTPVESNPLINRYGKGCIAYLRKVKGVPKRYLKIDTNSRVSLISMCQSYFVATVFLQENKEGF